MTQQTVSTLALQPPTSPEPRALQQWAANFVIQTRRLLEQVGQLQTVVEDIQSSGTAGVDEEAVSQIAAASAAEAAAELQAQLQQTGSALSDAINQLGVDLAALGLTVDQIEALTPQQIFEISLATRTNEILGGAGEAVQDAFDWAQTAAEAALKARVRGYETGANIRTVQRTVSEETRALAQNITTVTASINAVAGSLVTTQADVAAAEAAIAAAETAIAAAQSDVSQAQTDLAAAEANLTALQSSQTATQADLDAAEAAVAQAQSDLTAAEGRLTTAEAAITSLQTQVTQISADVTAETTARVSGDNALAQQLTTVSTSVGANTSAVTQLQQSVDGIESRWGVSINANGHVQGLIQLDGGASGSNFVAVVDRFLIAKPDGTGSTPVFATGTINGIGNSVGISGALLVDGTIFARHIAAGQISADKMSVTSLAAIAANLGTITAGTIRDAANTYEFDVANGLIRRIDNTMKIDLKNKDFRIEV